MAVSDSLKDAGYLAGQMLIAMPEMADPHFARTVIYICAHNADGAMGLVVNRLIDTLSFSELLEQIDIKPTPICDRIRVHFGGPVEPGCGFVLHSTDYMQESTKLVGEVGLTMTVDVLRAIADNHGPRSSLLALGCAGWAPGQLDDEIRENAWLNVSADEELLFGPAIENKWERAIAKIGVNFSMLSGEAGHA